MSGVNSSVQSATNTFAVGLFPNEGESVIDGAGLTTVGGAIRLSK